MEDVSNLNENIIDTSEEVNNKKENMCRFCLDEEDPDTMISPCSCKGTQMWVHRDCLRNWRRRFSPRHANATTCQLCKQPYDSGLDVDIVRDERPRKRINPWLILPVAVLACMIFYNVTCVENPSGMSLHVLGNCSVQLVPFGACNALFYVWMARRYFGVFYKHLCACFVYFCVVTIFLAIFDGSGSFQTLFSGFVVVKTKDDFGFIARERDEDDGTERDEDEDIDEDDDTERDEDDGTAPLIV